MHALRADLMLTGARLLLDHQHFNSAADRAYYAMCHAAVAAALHRGASLPASHRGLRTTFGLLVVATGRADRAFSRQLAVTFNLRQDSTYDPRYLVSRQEAERAISEADALVAAMKHVIGGQ